MFARSLVESGTSASIISLIKFQDIVTGYNILTSSIKYVTFTRNCHNIKCK